MLVDGDPTADLNALRKVRMVVRKGDVLFPEEVYSTVGITPFAKRPPLHSGDSAQGQYEAQLTRLTSHEPLQGPPAQDVAFVNVNVLPMTTDRVLHDQVVLVVHGRIAGLGPAGKVEVPAGIRTIDGAGGYLMPGLADMHVHSAGNPLTLALFLANGVTTVREMSGRPSYLDWSRRVAAGELLGPSIYTTGPIVGGRRDEVETIKVSDAAEAARVVAGQYEAGYRILKPYTFLTAEEYQSALAVAKRKGMRVVGHVPYSVGTSGVLAAGQNEIAHVHSFHQDYFQHFDPQHVFAQYSIDPAFIPKVVPQIKRSAVAVTTTLIVDQALADSQDIERYSGREIQAYEPSAGTALMRSGDWGFNQLWPHEYLETVYLPYLYKLTAALHSAGVPLVLGTDSGVPGLIHGFSTHEELGLLVRAGLTPFAALEAATVTAAAVSDDHDWGTVERGKRADLLLLQANPLEQIGRTRQILGVMKAGRWLDRGTLDHLLEQVREAYQ
jgi:imidazolonepropionase-like amidohydrolase